MNTFETVALICFIIAGVFFVISIVLFFVLDMVKVIGDLTGHTAKKEIENIRSQNQKTGNKAYKPSVVNSERGKLTDRISPSGKILEKKSISIQGSVGTEKIGSTNSYSGYEETTLLENGQDGSTETTVLNQDSAAVSETTVLSNETNVLNTNTNETTVLNNSDQTTVLNTTSDDDKNRQSNINYIAIDVSVLQEIKIINTQEIIC